MYFIQITADAIYYKWLVFELKSPSIDHLKQAFTLKSKFVFYIKLTSWGVKAKFEIDM